MRISATHLTAAGKSSLARAETLLESAQGQDLSDHKLSDLSCELAGQLLLLSQSLQTPEESKQNRVLARLMHDRKGQLFSTLLTDRIPRLQRGADIVRQALNVLRKTGVPRSMPPLDRVQLQALKVVGPLLASVVGPAVRKRIRAEALPFLIPGDTELLSEAVRDLKGPGVRVNVNQLGEEVLGHNEAEQHMSSYLALLANPDVDTISVKISSICAQLDVLAWQSSLDRVCESLERLYRAAMKPDGPSKVVMLDMEAYRDLELTHRAFVQVLSKPEFSQLSAGIVLQAYLPDSHAVQEEIIDWAKQRVADGGAAIHMRLVKGANLAVERVESSLSGWALPIYESKATVDGSFKAMVDRALSTETLGAVQLGVASHNLFDVSYCLLLLSSRQLEHGVEFEVLAGMAGALSRSLLALGRQVLIYSPAVSTAHLHSAVAYLVRRLDENTAKENFLRHSFDVVLGDDAWKSQEQGFRTSRDLQLQLDPTPKRRPAVIQVDSAPTACFENEIDTDFILRDNRQRLQEALEQQRNQEPPHLKLYIGGQALSRDPVSGFDPSRPDVVPYTISLATAKDIDDALAAGEKVAPSWAARAHQERATLVRKAATLMRQKRFELIAAMVMDGGKAVRDADAEISEAIDFADYYAVSFAELSDHADLQLRPRGLTVITPPWNFPLAIPLGGVFAALVAGNPTILKPARETAYIATKAAELCYEAGIPKEVLQLVVAEDSVATALITDPRVHAVVLTGGTTTAKLFKELRPNLHLLAETGGKNATIVSRFADQDSAVNAIVQSSFAHAGQKCSATSLLIVTPELAEDPRFVQQLCDAAQSMKVGSAWDLQSRVTPLINPPEGPLERGLTRLDEGESWWLEPKPSKDNPRLWSPAIKAGVKAGSYSHVTEFFGPVLSVMVADDLSEAIDWANATSYGLTAGFHSLDEAECEYFVSHMNAGNLYVNRTTTGAIVQRQPFGGRKASCFGPGSKAGGPNYVSMFVHMEQAEPPAERSGALSEPVERALRAYEDPALAIAATDYAVAAQEHFCKEWDPSAIRGQDNTFRYQFHTRILLVAFAGADPIELAKAAIAMTTLGVPYKVCLTNEANIDATLFGQAFGGESILKGSWLASLESGDFHRLRAIGDVTDSVLEEAAPRVRYLDYTAVLDNGRRELCKYVLEQSISTDFHRYGHLGLRELNTPADS